jgi:endonuclease/exonuclease/phosphatase family metal-dependent hydrolase
MHNVRQQARVRKVLIQSIDAFYPFGSILVMALRTGRLWPPIPLLVLLAAVQALPGCTGGFSIARRDALNLPGVTWFAPEVAADRDLLARWSAAVGPPVMRSEAAASSPSVADTLRVVSWNTALGAGDVMRLVGDIRAGSPNAHMVLLLQEVYREGPEVPVEAGPGIRYAGRLGGPSRRAEIEAVAATTGLNLYYVPSMRNGSPRDSDEDRGNAILSSLPLTELAAVELPFERQRRVAVAATVSGRSSDGRAWRLRLVSSHLDNMVGPRRGWFIGGEYGRIRQARALLQYLQGETAVVLGGDFNTWFGFGERTYAEIARMFPDSHPGDRRPTFMGLMRLDHLFFRLPDGWTGQFRRAADRYGSDHYPLVGTVTVR